ncbi:MAG: hypothetical protein ACYSXF_05495 [Planctomycetota bacterium]|jgi:hypothetical protein
MLKISHFAIVLAALLALAGMAGVAQAQVGLGDLASGICQNVEPNGFPGVIDQPAFIIDKTYDVFSPGDLNNPAPLAGNNTYVYTLTYVGSSCTPLGFAPPVVRFEIMMDTSQATGAGFIAASPGVAPIQTNSGAGVVSWQIQDPNNPGAFPGLTFPCPAGPGTSTKQLFIQSPLLPGLVSENATSTDGGLSLDAPGTCVGPFVEPMVEEGDAMPCTIGFWKNRFDGKQGTLQWFPEPDLTTVLNTATALCAAVFTDSTDLLTHLQSKGKRSILIRAKQQKAAWCLNMAAGDEFPNNMKCKLFDGNWIVDNACGVGLTVGDAFTQCIADITSGNDTLVHDAHDCADDVNNGISVINSMP